MCSSDLPVIHWKNILKRFEPKTVSKIAGRAQREIFIGIWGTRERAVAAAILILGRQEQRKRLRCPGMEDTGAHARKRRMARRHLQGMQCASFFLGRQGSNGLRQGETGGQSKGKRNAFDPQDSFDTHGRKRTCHAERRPGPEKLQAETGVGVLEKPVNKVRKGKKEEEQLGAQTVTPPEGREPESASGNEGQIGRAHV